jgi:hypothetical protein
MTDRYKSHASTHADDCWSWGHGHYECAVGRIERDEILLWQALEALEELQYAVVSTAKTDDVSLYYRAIVALHERLGVKE